MFAEFARVSKFCMSIPSVGSVTGITIRHDNTGTSANWFLDKVIVEDSSQTYTFPAYRWLDTTQLDGAISLNLTPGNFCHSKKSIQRAACISSITKIQLI